MDNMSKNDIFPSTSENIVSHSGSRTRDALSDGLIGLLGPSVEQVDERVRSVRYGTCLIIIITTFFPIFIVCIGESSISDFTMNLI